MESETNGLPQPSSAGRSYLSWNSEEDQPPSLSGVLFTWRSSWSSSESFWLCIFSAYHLDVDFRTASDSLSEVDILMVREPSKP